MAWFSNRVLSLISQNRDPIGDKKILKLRIAIFTLFIRHLIENHISIYESRGILGSSIRRTNFEDKLSRKVIITD